MADQRGSLELGAGTVRHVSFGLLDQPGSGEGSGAATAEGSAAPLLLADAGRPSLDAGPTPVAAAPSRKQKLQAKSTVAARKVRRRGQLVRVCRRREL